jgi:hypothetical protein
LKLNIISFPKIEKSRTESFQKAQNGLKLVPVSLIKGETSNLLLDWLIATIEESRNPLPRLSALEVLSDSILNYMKCFDDSSSDRGKSQLMNLICKFFNYDISEASYVVELIRLNKSLNTR